MLRACSAAYFSFKYRKTRRWRKKSIENIQIKLKLLILLKNTEYTNPYEKIT